MRFLLICLVILYSSFSIAAGEEDREARQDERDAEQQAEDEAKEKERAEKEAEKQAEEEAEAQEEAAKEAEKQAEEEAEAQEKAEQEAMANDPNYMKLYESSFYFGWDGDLIDFVLLDNQQLQQDYTEMWKGKYNFGFDLDPYIGMEFFYENDSYTKVSDGKDLLSYVGGIMFNFHLIRRSIFDVGGASPYIGIGYGYNVFDFQDPDLNTNYNVFYTRLGVQVPLNFFRLNFGFASNTYFLIEEPTSTGGDRTNYLKNNTSQAYLFAGFEFVIPFNETYVSKQQVIIQATQAAGQDEEDLKNIHCPRSSFAKPDYVAKGSEL